MAASVDQLHHKSINIMIVIGALALLLSAQVSAFAPILTGGPQRTVCDIEHSFTPSRI